MLKSVSTGGGASGAAAAAAAERRALWPPRKLCLLLCIQTLKTPLPTPISRQHSSTTASSRFWRRHPSRSDSACIRCFCSGLNLVRNRFLDADVAAPGGGGGPMAAAAAWGLDAATAGADAEPSDSSMCVAEGRYPGESTGGGACSGEAERSSS
ncbi:Os08g0438501 [Oryza sativa Japonica Group]|uniref:Os08g0438501 protein n=1 Tax=Oryza sativa subsp. japonica TaxID=39947 RepID=A0A0P0XGE3_ORYSJ|nr:Os08g0438501 [Oryza sativa Japonica Group]